MENAEKLERFFARYKQFQDERYERFVIQFGDVARRYKEFVLVLEEKHRITAPDFNIFRLLRVERNEINTHSAMLGDLLNPSGGHGQGELFLQRFLALYLDNHPENFSAPDSLSGRSSWLIESEKTTAWGRLDLVITNVDRSLLIAIENKIDANDQPDQLQRYFKWLESRSEFFHYRRLIYLTPKGHLSNDAQDKDVRYLCLSYKQDITKWLCACILEIQSAVLKETLTQYVSVISDL